jgi:hypothetical protein
MNGSMDSTTPPKKIGAGPKTRVCYVCGRLYGLNSFEIHLKQCKELWIAREAEKDPRERKKLPEDPMLKFAGGRVDESISGAGSGSSGNGNGGNVPTAQELEEINRLSTAAFNTEALDTCAYCGRTFLAEKLVIHNRSCTAENPARRLTDAVKRGGGASNTPSSSSVASTPSKVNGSGTGAGDFSPNPGRPGSSGASLSALKSASRAAAASSASPGAGGRPYGGGGGGGGGRSEYDEDGLESSTQNLRIENGNLVGHLGGSAGRPLRTSNGGGGGGGGGGIPSRAGASTAGVARTVFSVSEFQDKEEVVQYLVNKIDSLEAMSAELAQTIADVKNIVQQLV